MAAPDFQVGDEVAEYSSRGLHGSTHRTTVVRVTATQFVTERGNRYRRANGFAVGDHYGGELLPVDAPIVRRTLAQNALYSLRGQIDRKLPELRLETATTALDDITALVDLARKVVAEYES